MHEELEIVGQRESEMDGRLICVSERRTQDGAEVNKLLRGSVPHLSPRMDVSPLAVARVCSQFIQSVHPTSFSGA